MDITQIIATELSVKPQQVQATIDLLDEGNTIPFIARYRKELTGSLDDSILRDLFDRLEYLRGLEKRRGEIINSITEQNKMTPQLEEAITAAATLAALEDLYRPYKQKRRTRASIAKERGLEPLAEAIFAQSTLQNPLQMAESYIDPTKELPDATAALEGAKDIIAENISDDAAIRGKLRDLFMRQAQVTATAADEAAAQGTYAMYADYSEPLHKLAPHRILALHRAGKEKALKVSIALEPQRAMALVLGQVKKAQNPCAQVVEDAAADSYKRLIFPSLENEVMGTLFAQASEQAIKVFAINLGNLLMQAPVKDAVVLGLDPAYRTGCKIAVVDGTGKVLDTTVVYPTPPHNKTAEAAASLKRLIQKHKVTIIAIGNGTASKESEIFTAQLISSLGGGLSYMVVSEAGASVYSASKLAAMEFPEYDVSLRSAVSIARRLQDPLAELVKIDPKAIGIGQYQHDMPPARLDAALGGVVESCVNSVGVDLNTASFSLLEHVAGISPAIAKNIVNYRETNGRFKTRKELLKVEKLGPKTAQQCAGFLRVYHGPELLDCTAVHPESYPAAKALLQLCGYSIKKLEPSALSDIGEKARTMGLSTIATQLGIGTPTLADIVAELGKPGRDPRDSLPPPMLRTDVMDLKDLKPDMVLTGTVRNVIDFGAFVDIGVHEDGLVHISRICQQYIKHPSQVLKVGDIVKVKVLEVDLKRNRISLSMKDVEQ